MTECTAISNDDFLREFDALVNTALLRHNLIHVNVDVDEQVRLLNGAGSTSSSSSSSSGICDSSHSSFTNYKQRLNFNHEFSESLKIENQSKFFNTSKRQNEPCPQSEPIIMNEGKSTTGLINLKQQKQQQKQKPLTSITNLKNSTNNVNNKKSKFESTNKASTLANPTNSPLLAGLKTFNTKTNLKGNLLASPTKQPTKFSTSTLRKTSNRTKKQPTQPSNEVKKTSKLESQHNEKEECMIGHDDTDLDVSEIVSPFNPYDVKEEHSIISQSFLTMSSCNNSTDTSDESSSLSAINPCDVIETAKKSKIRKKYSRTDSSASSASSSLPSDFSIRGSSLTNSSSFDSYTNHKRPSHKKKKCNCKQENDQLVRKLVSILIELVLVIMLKNNSSTTRANRNHLNKKTKLNSLINGITKSTLTNLIDLAQVNTLVKSKEMRQFKTITSILLPHLKQKKTTSVSSAVSPRQSKNVSEIQAVKPIKLEYNRSKSMVPLKLNQLEIPNIDDPILFIDTIYNQLLANNIQTIPVINHSFDVNTSLTSSHQHSLNIISIENKNHQDDLDTVTDFYNNNDFSFIDLYSNHTNDLISCCDNTKDIEIKNRLIDWNYDTDAEADQDCLQATLATTTMTTHDAISSYKFDNEYLNSLLDECNQLTTRLNQAMTPEFSVYKTPPPHIKYFNDDLNLSLRSLNCTSHKFKRSASFSSILSCLDFMTIRSLDNGYNTSNILVNNAMVTKRNSKVHVVFSSIIKSLKFLFMTKNVVLVPFIIFLLNAKYLKKEFSSDKLADIQQQPVAASLFAYKALSSVFIPASTLTQICANTATAAASASLNSLIASYKR